MHSTHEPGAVRLLVIPSLILVVSLGLSIGLTFAPCYASLCNEEFYPFETRLHVAIYYALLGLTGCALAAHAHVASIRRAMSHYIIRKPLPFLGFRVTVGGTLLTLWIGGVILACIGIWLPAAENFYGPRAAAVNWLVIEPYLAVTNLIGHHCDMLAGLLLFPISRNSLIGRAFKLHTPTLLLAHKFIAYWLLISIVAHALPYFLALGQMAQQSDQTKRNAFDQDNPNLSIPEAEHRSPWVLAVLGEGVLALLVMVIMVITSLPYFRRVAYNTFYYFHVIGGVLFMILICFHASSDFYCLLPGLLLWTFDLLVRLRSLLRPKAQATLEATDNGWYRVLLPPGNGHRVDTEKVSLSMNPLQTYYVNVPAASKAQVHAFTASQVETSAKGAELLFRKATGNRSEKKQRKEWTWKMADLLPPDTKSIPIDIRVEGPYMHDISRVHEATHVLCIVGGTGLTGAYSMANDWLLNRASDADSHFTLVWTIREAATAEIVEIEQLRDRVAQTSNMTLEIHNSTESGRINPNDYICRIFDTPASKNDLGALRSPDEGEKITSVPAKVPKRTPPAQGFVYCSGPDGLLRCTEQACIRYKAEMRKDVDTKQNRLDWYVACWEV